MKNLDLIKKAKNLRKETFDAFVKKGEAHLGGSFSMIETLVYLLEKVLKKNDKFILSKSHASYPFILMLRKKGFKPKLTTHLEIDEKNGINCTTGSLGHGFPIGVGMALARKIMKKKGNIYVMVSDGECQEGTTWEASLIAAKYNLANLFLIIDYNKIQALTTLKEGLPLSSLKKKFKTSKKKNKPTVFIVHTIKGKGIKQFENDPVWHARKIEGKDIEVGNKSLK